MSIHVLVAGLPRLLSEVVSAGLANAPDLSLAAVTGEGARPGSAELDAAIDSHRPDAAIVGMHSTEADALEQTQLRHRSLAILAVAPDGTQAWNLALKTELRPLDATSPTGLRRAIHDAVAHNIATGQATREPCRIADSTPESEEGP